jgi:polyhydroxyalkanoate synthesis regulator phasin
LTSEQVKIDVEKEDMTDEEALTFHNELSKSVPQQQQQQSKKRKEEKNEIVRVKAGILPPSESDDTASSLKILTDDEQAAVRKRNLDRKSSYYYSECMKKDHVIPLKMAEDPNTDEEIWEERKFQYHELTFEQEDKLQELRATMDDLEKQTFLFNRERAMRSDQDWQTVKRQWQHARRNWAFFAGKAFLHISEEDINRCKSSTLINVIEACEYRNAVTVPF